jgi:hypothetical protein
MTKSANYYDKKYFDDQKIIGQRSGKFVAKRFQKYISPKDRVLV